MFIYVLRLHFGKYYVGKTDHLHERLEAHIGGYGCEYTKRYHVKKVIEIFETEDPFDEDKITKKYMSKYGIKNVRGGSYTQFELKEEEIKVLEKEIQHGKNLCFQCGKKGHYSNQCFQSSLFVEDSISISSSISELLSSSEEKVEDVIERKEEEEMKKEKVEEVIEIKEEEMKKEEVKSEEIEEKKWEEWREGGKKMIENFFDQMEKMEKKTLPFLSKMGRDIKKYWENG